MTSEDLKIPQNAQLTSKEPTNEIVVNSTDKTLEIKNKTIRRSEASQVEGFELHDEYCSKIEILGLNYKKNDYSICLNGISKANYL